MHARHLFTRLVVSLLLLAQTACASATGSRIWVTEKGDDRLTDHVSPGDQVYLLLNDGRSLEGEVDAVHDDEILVEDHRVELAEIERIQLLSRSNSQSDGMSWGKISLVFAGALLVVAAIAAARNRPSPSDIEFDWAY